MAEQKQIWAVGRRKTAVARVKLTEGTGKITINGTTVAGYLKLDEARTQKIFRPLEMINLKGKVDILINVGGGGISGQMIAIQHGIARAVAKKMGDAETIKELRKEGLLTRDSRMVERKKYGLHKARRGTQFSKR